jgi:replicative DNA helicase
MNAHNLGVDAEKNIIACVVMYGRNAWLSIADAVVLDDFTTPEHRNIVDVISILDVEGEQMDIDLVVQQADVSGIEVSKSYLIQLQISYGCIPSALPMQVKLIQLASHARAIEKAHGEMGKAIQSGADPLEVIDAQTQTLLSLTTSIQRSDRVDYHVSEVVSTVVGDYNAMEDLRRLGIDFAGLDSGFREINDALNGLREEEETVLAARPSIGKTALGLKIGLNVARNTDKHVDIWSAEMSRGQVVGRLVQMVASIDAEEMRKGRLSPDDKRVLKEAAEEVAELPITIYETPGLTVGQFTAQAERSRMRHDVGLTIIDHLHRMDGPGSSLYEKYTRISTGLRDYTFKTGTPHCLILVQLNRKSEGKEDKVPEASEMRDSGGIEQDAVNVMLIHRPGHYRAVRKAAEAANKLEELLTYAELIFPKTRFGPTGEKMLYWNTTTASFESARDAYHTETF